MACEISSLPDHLLSHILSFLPTKYVVATSALARRWRLLWTHVTRLDFDDGYVDSDSVSCSHSMSYANFVTWVLSRNTKSISSFRIALRGECDAKIFNKWISIAAARCVQTIDLSLDHQVTVPPRLFECNSLVNLRLSFCLLSHVPRSICAPSLKTLHLSYVNCKDYESLPNLISGCVVLEELAIRGIICDDNVNLVDCEISSPTLRCLLLSFTFSSYPNRSVKLDAPALECLKLSYDVYGCISAPTLPALVKADIFLCSGTSYERLMDMCVLFPLLESLSKVKGLRIGGTMALFMSELSPFPMRFDCLSKLDLVADWRILIRFLQCANNLEVLIIREAADVVQGWAEPESVPSCLLSCIRAVSIHSFGYRECDFNMVRYILRNAKVLKLMNIYSASYVNAGGIKRISMFERGSETCEISIS